MVGQGTFKAHLRLSHLSSVRGGKWWPAPLAAAARTSSDLSESILFNRPPRWPMMLFCFLLCCSGRVLFAVFVVRWCFVVTSISSLSFVDKRLATMRELKRKWPVVFIGLCGCGRKCGECCKGSGDLEKEKGWSVSELDIRLRNISCHILLLDIL